GRRGPRRRSAQRNRAALSGVPRAARGSALSLRRARPHASRDVSPRAGLASLLTGRPRGRVGARGRPSPAPRAGRVGTPRLRLLAGHGGRRRDSLSARGCAAAPAAGDDPLAPGAAVGLSLIRGDVSATGVGTVTLHDGNRVLAFGHPLFNLGPVDLPMTAARVEALLPSLQNSFKFAAPGRELGAIRSDR